MFDDNMSFLTQRVTYYNMFPMLFGQATYRLNFVHNIGLNFRIPYHFSRAAKLLFLSSIGSAKPEMYVYSFALPTLVKKEAASSNLTLNYSNIFVIRSFSQYQYRATVKHTLACRKYGIILKIAYIFIKNIALFIFITHDVMFHYFHMEYESHRL